MIETNISTNENLVQVFCGVRGYEKDGVAYLHIEDVARGLGFTTVATSGYDRKRRLESTRIGRNSSLCLSPTSW